MSRCWPKKPGYDGVEIMGSEGYFLNQFLGDPHQPAGPTAGAAAYKNRMRFPVEVVRQRARGLRRPEIYHHLPAFDARPG